MMSAERKRLWEADVDADAETVDESLEEIGSTIAHAREARGADSVRIEVTLRE